MSTRLAALVSAAWQNPAILRQICVHSADRELLGLLRVNNATFAAAASILYREIDLKDLLAVEDQVTCVSLGSQLQYSGQRGVTDQKNGRACIYRRSVVHIFTTVQYFRQIQSPARLYGRLLHLDTLLLQHDNGTYTFSAINPYNGKRLDRRQLSIYGQEALRSGNLKLHTDDLCDLEQYLPPSHLKDVDVVLDLLLDDQTVLESEDTLLEDNAAVTITMASASAPVLDFLDDIISSDKTVQAVDIFADDMVANDLNRVLRRFADTRHTQIGLHWEDNGVSDMLTAAEVLCTHTYLLRHRNTLWLSFVVSALPPLYAESGQHPLNLPAFDVDCRRFRSIPSVTIELNMPATLLRRLSNDMTSTSWDSLVSHCRPLFLAVLHLGGPTCEIEIWVGQPHKQVGQQGGAMSSIETGLGRRLQSEMRRMIDIASARVRRGGGPGWKKFASGGQPCIAARNR